MSDIESFRNFIKNNIPEINLPKGKKIGRYRLGKGMMVNFRISENSVNIFFYSGNKESSHSIFSKINELGLNGKKINDKYLLMPVPGVKNPNVVRMDLEVPFEKRAFNSDLFREEVLDIYSQLIELCKPIAREGIKSSAPPHEKEQKVDIESDDATVEDLELMSISNQNSESDEIKEIKNNKLINLQEEWTVVHKVASIIFGAYNFTKHEQQKKFIQNSIIPNLKDVGADLTTVWDEVSAELDRDQFSYKYRLYTLISDFSKSNEEAKESLFHCVTDLLNISRVEKEPPVLTTGEDEYLSMCMYYWYADNLNNEDKVDVNTILDIGIKSIVPDLRNLITLNPGTLCLHKWYSLEEITLSINKDYKDIFRNLSFKEYVKNLDGELEIKIEGRMHFYKLGVISDEIKTALNASIAYTGHSDVNEIIADMWYGSPKEILNSVPNEIFLEHTILDHLKKCSMGQLWQEFDLFYEVPVIDNDNIITFFKDQEVIISVPVSNMMIANDSEKDEYDTAEDKNFIESAFRIRNDFNEDYEWDSKKDSNTDFGEYIAEEGAKFSRFGWSGLEHMIIDNERKSNFNRIEFENRFSVIEYGKFELKSDCINTGSTNFNRMIWLKDKGINEFGPSGDNYRFSKVFFVDSSGEERIIRELDFIIENFNILDVTASQRWPTDE